MARFITCNGRYKLATKPASTEQSQAICTLMRQALHGDDRSEPVTAADQQPQQA
jgi:hypothetical protein